MGAEADLKRIIQRLQRKRAEAKHFQEVLTDRIKDIDKELAQLKTKQRLPKEKR